MYYMLDTNICIYIIKQKPPKVLNKFKTLTLGNVGISSITLAELQYGVEKSLYPQKNKNALLEFVISLEVVPFDDLAAVHYGEIRTCLEKIGKPIGPLDFMIAAHARSLNATLVTNNKKEFKRVPHLTVEDWT